MGEPIAGRISEDEKKQLEHIADERNTSVSNLVGMIVGVWLHDRGRGDAADLDAASSGQDYADDFDELAGQVELLRHHLRYVFENTDGIGLKTWVMRQGYDERRPWDELEEPENTITSDDIDIKWR
jgi:hypothetical protein